MKSEFRKTVEKLAEQNDDARNHDGSIAVFALCTDCQEQLNVRSLAQHGGKCPRCFEAYCASAFAPRAVLPETATQREWRRRLRQPAPEPDESIAAELHDNARRVEEYRRAQSAVHRAKDGQDVPDWHMDEALLASGDLDPARARFHEGA